MGIYFDEEREKSRWDSGQAILHKETPDHKKEHAPQRDNEAYRIQNSYGTLRYLKKDKKKDGKTHGKEGFAVEAFEAPGTPIHTEKEKHIDKKTMKKIRQNNKQTLFSSETPLRDQALFFDMRNRKKSADLVKYMKELLHRQGHQTLIDTFGFLDQEPERMELAALKSSQKESLTPEERDLDKQLLPEERQDAASRRIDTLNSRLHRKESKERQLCSELQLMLDQRTREEFLEGHQNLRQNEQESPQKDRTKNRNDNSPQRRLYSDPELPESAAEEAAGETPDEVPEQSDTTISR